jgi:hypothetical protein
VRWGESWGEIVGSDLANVQFKAIWSCHNESHLYKEYILVQMGKKTTWAILPMVGWGNN